MLKRILPYVMLLMFILPAGLNAQRWKLRRYEAVFGAGFNSYFGDIGGAATTENFFGIKDISIKSTRPSLYLGARYKIRENVSVKLNFNYGFISGNDEGSKNNDRGFKFSSQIFEPSVQAEYSIISEESRASSNALFNKRGMINNYSQINLYLYAGIGAVKYSPKPNDAMKSSLNYDPDYSTLGIVFPAGLGLKYVFNQNWSVGVEFGARWTTTDMLDAYTSPYSKANDLYYLGVINGIYRIKTSREGYPLFGRRARSFL
jgi:hypothetical protein